MRSISRIFIFSLLFVISAADDSCIADIEKPPYVHPRVMMGGKVTDLSEDSKEYNLSPVYSCTKDLIGMMPQFTTEQSFKVLEHAKSGWDNGKGQWSQLSLSERIAAVEKFIVELQKKRTDIVKMLMYEIGKNYNDACSEFDRTIIFIQESIAFIRTSSDFETGFRNVSGSKVFIRRNSFGIVLALGPYNYPLNETYATIIPALLMGNVVILKIPAVGGLSHLLTFEAFSNAFPPNTVHFISGSGRSTLPPLMESGHVNGLAFIGGASAADKLIKQHPEPHRLKLFLQLEAKNMAIILPDMFKGASNEPYPLSKALDEIISGSLSFNGQRCTALKLVFAPKGSGTIVADELAKRVERFNKGMPWQVHEDGKYSNITPLPNNGRIEYMRELIADALDKGGTMANSDGGTLICPDHDDDCTQIMVPAIIYNVNSGMKIFTEEQFGPIVPIVEYDSLEDVLSYGLQGKYGQQVSIFTNEATSEAALLVDTFSSIFGKMNINSQCGRSPDSVPFTARRSSGLGVMSIEDALKEFSIPTVVSYKHDNSASLIDAIASQSSFMKGL